MAGDQIDDPGSHAAALVSAAFSAITGRTQGLDQATASRRVSAAVKEIQDAPDDIGKQGPQGRPRHHQQRARQA
jgi:hypothetical protein